MNPQRPLAVLFVAILCFVAGGFGTFCNLFSVFGPLIQAAIEAASNTGANPAAPPKMTLGENWAAVANWALSVADLFFSLTLIVLGLGLLGMRRWARLLGLTMAALLILSATLNVIFTINQFRLERPHEELGVMGSATGAIIGFITSAGAALFWLGVAVALMIVLLRPSVARTFPTKQT